MPFQNIWTYLCGYKWWTRLIGWVVPSPTSEAGTWPHFQSLFFSIVIIRQDNKIIATLSSVSLDLRPWVGVFVRVKTFLSRDYTPSPLLSQFLQKRVVYFCEGTVLHVRIEHHPNKSSNVKNCHVFFLWPILAYSNVGIIIMYQSFAVSRSVSIRLYICRFCQQGRWHPTVSSLCQWPLKNSQVPCERASLQSQK